MSNLHVLKCRSRHGVTFILILVVHGTKNFHIKKKKLIKREKKEKKNKKKKKKKKKKKNKQKKTTIKKN